MTTEKQNIGKLGEDIAVKYLGNNGYRILERNYRKPWGEIDIVAEKSKELIFFEVKTQKDYLEWEPEENVNRHKKYQLSRIINTYIKEHKISESQEWRVDILAIRLNLETKNAEVKHINNVILS